MANNTYYPEYSVRPTEKDSKAQWNAPSREPGLKY